MNLLAALVVVVLSYIAVTLTATLTPAIQDLGSVAADNGYSPYSMYQRCHPAQFHIPDERSC